MEMESRLFQSMPDTEVFSPCSIEHQDVFMYEDERMSVKCEKPDSPTYLDISSSKSTHEFPHVKTEPDPDTLMSWTQKHPEHWSQNEILDWIYFVASEIDVDPTTIRGEGFQNITGPQLCRMTLDDFLVSDPVNGKCFYDMFRVLHKDAFFIEPADVKDFNNFNTHQYSSYGIKQEPHYGTTCEQMLDQTRDVDNFITNLNGKGLHVLLGAEWYDIDPYITTEVRSMVDEVANRHLSESGYSSSDGESISETSDMDAAAGYDVLYAKRQMEHAHSHDTVSDDDIAHMTSSYVPKETTPKRKPTTKRKQLKPGEQAKPQNRGRKPGQISKGNHLWEFIRDLLKDPKYNPHLLRWEEKETGVFRFVQSEAVAQMWGRKKNNPGMTYEKLSRAMRFCRTAGYFADVPKTGKFPKKLCFRFGTKAYGWAD